MTPSLSLSLDDTLRTKALHKRELISLVSEKYGIARAEAEALDRTGLMRIADAFDFLENNLPPNTLFK
jgi:hypothetical protein